MVFIKGVFWSLCLSCIKSTIWWLALIQTEVLLYAGDSTILLSHSDPGQIANRKKSLNHVQIG